jgi:hypothetical protein
MSSWRFISASLNVSMASCLSTGSTLLSSLPYLLPQRQIRISLLGLLCLCSLSPLGILKDINETFINLCL